MFPTLWQPGASDGGGGGGGGGGDDVVVMEGVGEHPQINTCCREVRVASSTPDRLSQTGGDRGGERWHHPNDMG